MPPLRDDHAAAETLPKTQESSARLLKYNRVNVGVYAPVVKGGTIRRGDAVVLA